MIFKTKYIILPFLILMALFSCSETDPKLDNEEEKEESELIKADSIVFAVIGDYGFAGFQEESVANLVKSWEPDFILTTGDNNYENGLMSTMKENISQYYGDYIYNYDAPVDYRCNGKAFEDSVNRFFPCPGNHDYWNVDTLSPYLDFFTLPGEEIYYKFQWGPVSFYSINSTALNMEPQKLWLVAEIAISKSVFNIVYFHHAPYTTGTRGNEIKMQWDFYELGFDIVLTGHDHLYSRIELASEPGMVYVVNGLGGRSIYTCATTFLPADTTVAICYQKNYGAIRASANNEKLEMKFYSIDNSDIAVDSVIVFK